MPLFDDTSSKDEIIAELVKKLTGTAGAPKWEKTARSKEIYKKMLERGWSSNLKSLEEIKVAYLSLVKGMDALTILEEDDWKHAMEQFQIADCTILIACVEKFVSKEANLSLLDNKSNTVWTSVFRAVVPPADHTPPLLLSFLTRLGLQQYAGLLAKEGFEDPANLQHITDDEYKSIGILVGHRAKIRAFFKDAPNVKEEKPQQFWEGDFASFIPFFDTENGLFALDCSLRLRYSVANALPDKAAAYDTLYRYLLHIRDSGEVSEADILFGQSLVDELHLTDLPLSRRQAMRDTLKTETHKAQATNAYVKIDKAIADGRGGNGRAQDRGRGRGRGGRGRSTDTCYYCGLVGHRSTNCHSKQAGNPPAQGSRYATLAAGFAPSSPIPPTMPKNVRGGAIM